jgi:diguanylate cyclase (GGDEF)-like protein
MGLNTVAYAAVLALPGNSSDQVAGKSLGTMSVWLPTVVCWLAVARVGFRRWEAVLAAAAVTSFAAGGTYYGVLTMDGPVTFPTPADIGFLLVCPLMLASLVVATRRHVHGIAWSVRLDCAVGSLGAASLLAVVLSPVLAAALVGSTPLATVVAVARPMCDLLVMAAVAGTAALGARGMGSRWFVLILGLLFVASTDAAYALQVTAGTYVIGTPLDAGFAIGLALTALWVDSAQRPGDSMGQQVSPATSGAALTVSSVATATGLGVLVVGNRMNFSTLAVSLAAVTLLAAAARTQLSYRQLAWMADLRNRAATTDDLTGLPNRRALYAEGHARLADPRQACQALLMLDLDKFKEVNDSLGHHVGDLLLIQVGARLLEHLREGDVLARLGGDEFAVLLQDAGPDEATDVATKLRTALSEPFTLDDFTLHSSASVGIALFPNDGPDLSTLLRKADIAMYKAKTSGNGHHLYRGVDDADEATRLQTVEELRTALTCDQLVVHYQPKINLDTGDVHGVEALVRWDHPSLGLLYPEAFLHLVEESRLMPTLTRIVLTQALDQAVRWQAQGHPLTVSVNLSASSLTDADLPQEIATMLSARGITPRTLQLEITEQSLMADRHQAHDILTRLRQTGVQIAIDDFGTGYSSLGYLRDLPIDELKLDRSFIFPMADDARAAALVASTVTMAHNLGLRMVAEGVETTVALTELTRLGCDQAQGYLMSRPVPAAELDHWLSDRRPVRQGTGIPEARPTAALG